MIKIDKITTCIPLPSTDHYILMASSFLTAKKKIATIERKMQQDINKISKWTVKIGFNISCYKTKCMHFCQIHKMLNHPTLILNGAEIPKPSIQILKHYTLPKTILHPSYQTTEY